MPDKQQRKTKKDKITDPAKIKAFFEELSWLLATYSNIDFKSMPNTIGKYFSTFTKESIVMRQYISDSPNQHFLVGILPSVLNDESLFATNEDIAQFAKTVMKVNLLRYGKKSRYELIGTIVCETNKLNDFELTELVNALTVLARKKDKAKSLIAKRRQENYGWNMIIQELARGNINGQNNK